MNTNPTNTTRPLTPPMEGEGANPNAPLPVAAVQQAAREAPATGAPTVRPSVIVSPQQRPSVIVRNPHVPMPEPVAGPSRTPEPVAGPSQGSNSYELPAFSLFPGARPVQGWRRQPYDPEIKRRALEMHRMGMNGAEIRRELVRWLGEDNTPQQSTINKWIKKENGGK